MYDITWDKKDEWDLLISFNKNMLFNMYMYDIYNKKAYATISEEMQMQHSISCSG